MAIARKAIKDVIVETLQGDGGTRALSSGIFLYGVFDGQTEQAQASKIVNTIDARHRFDVLLGGVSTNQASNVSNSGSRRIVNMPVTIRVRTHLKTQPQIEDRDDVLGQVMSDCEDAIQALAYPGALTTTLDGRATGIVGGLMRAAGNSGVPEWRQTAENWSLKRVESEITGTVIVSVEANAA